MLMSTQNEISISYTKHLPGFYTLMNKCAYKVLHKRTFFKFHKKLFSQRFFEETSLFFIWRTTKYLRKVIERSVVPSFRQKTFFYGIVKHLFIFTSVVILEISINVATKKYISSSCRHYVLRAVFIVFSLNKLNQRIKTLLIQIAKNSVFIIFFTFSLWNDTWVHNTLVLRYCKQHI